MSAIQVVTLSRSELEELLEEAAARGAARVAQAPQPKTLRILTTDEAAVIARRKPDTIREWIQSGRLKALPRSGREPYQIREDDLEAALTAANPGGVDADAWAGEVIALARGR